MWGDAYGGRVKCDVGAGAGSGVSVTDDEAGLEGVDSVAADAESGGVSDEAASDTSEGAAELVPSVSAVGSTVSSLASSFVSVGLAAVLELACSVIA